MGQMIAVYRNGRCAEIVELRTKDVKRENYERLVDVSKRPDIKVGHVWGTEPDGYGTTYDVIDSKIVQRTPAAVVVPPVVQPK
jgi:hypothetical protein